MDAINQLESDQATEATTENVRSPVKILGNECIQIDPLTTVIRQNNNVKTELSVDLQISDTENQQFDEQMGSNDDEQSSENSKTQRSSKFSSPKSSSENTLDDRRLRRQIANCNERRRMQSINAGFQALRQFLPQRCGEKLSKAAILQQTAELIQHLQLEKSRRPTDRPSDEEVNEGDRPQCKKRRIAIKTEQREEKPGVENSHLESQIPKYMKIIEELQSALGKEQQLRIIYEQKLIDLKNTLSASLGFGSLPSGLNLDQNENIQQAAGVHTRSLSADGGLLTPKNFCEMPTNSGLLYNSLAPSTELGYNNLRLNRQPASGSLSALLSPNHLIGGDLHFGGASPFAQQLLASQNIVNLLTASLHQAAPDVQHLNGQTSVNQSPITAGAQQNSKVLFAIAEALRQIESENSKNFSSESLSTDVLVR